MNKAELNDAIAKSAEISRATAGNALDGALSAIKSSLKKSGRNPQTGATIKLKASKGVKFRAGKALKDSIR